MKYEKDVGVDNTPLQTDPVCQEILQGRLNSGNDREVFERNKNKEHRIIDSSDSVADQKPYETHVSQFSNEEGMQNKDVMKNTQQSDNELSIANQCSSTNQTVFGTGNQDPQVGAQHGMNYAAAMSEGNQGSRDKNGRGTDQYSKPRTRSQTAAQ